MFYLVLAILSSAMISILMRLSNQCVKNNMVMFAANYLICGALSALFLCLDSGLGMRAALGSGADASAGDMTFAVGLGLVSGVLYLVSFMLLQFNIAKNGMVLAATFMKLGVLVPIVMSVTLGWDQPTMLQLVGVVLALAAIIIINSEGDGSSIKAASAGLSMAGIWLIVLLVIGGFTDSLSNIYDKLGAPALKNQYLLWIFIAATLVSVLMIFVRRQHFTWADALWGAVIGVPNYFSARFLLYALGSVPAIVAYPVYNIAVILLISTVGFLLFHEKLSRRKSIGLGLIVAAILVLNL